jgi:uncharacterized protein YecE (DUF72 family)
MGQVLGRVVVGTSSWADPGFVEEWYPPGLPARDRLPYYAERFDAVEVNSTFYAVPSESTVLRWAEATPERFTFDVKLHRALSRHSAPLDSLPRDLRERARIGSRGRVELDDRLEGALVEATLEAVAPLVRAGKLSSFLLQCSPAFSPKGHSIDELTPLVKRLHPLPLALELRHRGWLEEGRIATTLGWMVEHGVAHVCLDAPAGKAPTLVPAIDAVTRDGLAYLRAHGRDAEAWMRGRSVAERFAYSYSDAELEEIKGRAQWLAERVGPAGAVRVHFNNNRGSDAPVAAQRLRELLSQEPAQAGKA